MFCRVLKPNKLLYYYYLFFNAYLRNCSPLVNTPKRLLNTLGKNFMRLFITTKDHWEFNLQICYLNAEKKFLANRYDYIQGSVTFLYFPERKNFIVNTAYKMFVSINQKSVSKRTILKCLWIYTLTSPPLSCSKTNVHQFLVNGNRLFSFEHSN